MVLAAQASFRGGLHVLSQFFIRSSCVDPGLIANPISSIADNDCNVVPVQSINQDVKRNELVVPRQRAESSSRSRIPGRKAGGGASILQTR